MAGETLASFGRALALVGRQKANLAPVDTAMFGRNSAWFPVIKESSAGAWQRNVILSPEQVIAFHAVFACMTLIASDISKLQLKLVQLIDGIWTETTSPSFSPVLRKPNSYQNRIQFWENWILSKLSTGNMYALKQRDDRGVVTSLYILDPTKVMPRVSEDGQVFYELRPDNLTGITKQIIVPAREIIHDRMNSGLFHPLVGISPLYAAGLAATQGLQIQSNSTRLFRNNSMPGGILSAAGEVLDADAEEIKAGWEENFGGENIGRVAVLGNGMKFEQMALTAVDAQLIEQLKWAAENVCSAFHVPPYKIGIGEMPKFTNVQSLNIEYFQQCLQKLIEDGELCMDEGLGIGDGVGTQPYYGTQFDTPNLLRMDSITQMEVLDKAKSIMTPDEQRAQLMLPKTPGGNVVYRQQQDFSLEALAKRDAQPDPFGSAKPPASDPAALPPPAAPMKDGADGRLGRKFTQDVIAKAERLRRRRVA